MLLPSNKPAGAGYSQEWHSDYQAIPHLYVLLFVLCVCLCVSLVLLGWGGAALLQDFSMLALCEIMSKTEVGYGALHS